MIMPPKRYLIGFAIFLALVALAAYGLFRIQYLNPNRHRSQIIRYVESNYNVKLEVGLILPIVYPGVGIEMHNVRVELTDPGRSKPQLLSCRSVKAVIYLGELIRYRRLRFKDLIFYRPEVYYEWGPKERERLRHLRREQPEQSGDQAGQTGMAGRAADRMKSVFQFKFNPDELLSAGRVLVNNGAFKVADFRPDHEHIPDMEFSDVNIGLTRGRQENTFDFWTETSFPYSRNGRPGRKLRGKGKVKVSLKPFRAVVTSDDASWGQNPIRKFECEFTRGEDRLQFNGAFESAMDAENLNLLLEWPALSKWNRTGPYQLSGQAEFRMQFRNGDNFWERFHLERLRLDNVGVSIFRPGPDSKFKEVMVFQKVKFSARDVAPNKPVPVQLSMPFPWQQPLGKLKPVPLELEGDLNFDPKFNVISFRANKANFGDNAFSQFDLDATRNQDSFGFKAGLNVRANDLSQFQELLRWRSLPLTPNMAYMNFSGNGRIIAELRYPGAAGDAKKKFYLSGSARLDDVYFDPGSAIAPVEKFTGEISMAPGEISLPTYWFQIGQMPIQSDMVFSYGPGQNPTFQFQSVANDLDLAELFIKRVKPPNPDLLPGSTLRLMRTIYQGDFAGQRVTYKKIEMDGVKTHWEFRDRSLGFRNLTLNYRDGWYQDAGSWVDFRRANRTTWHYQGHFENFPLRRMMAELFGYDFFVDGRATGQGYLSGTYVDNKLDYSSLNGYFKAQVNNGSLIGYNIGIRILQFLGFKIESKKYGLDFEKGKAEVVIKDGVVYFDDLSIKSWNLESHSAGKVDLANQTVNLWVAVYPLEVLSTVTRPIPVIGALINQTQEALFGSYAKASGAWSDVKVSGYLPLVERVPTAPGAPEFPPRPWPWLEEKDETE